MKRIHFVLPFIVLSLTTFVYPNQVFALDGECGGVYNEVPDSCSCPISDPYRPPGTLSDVWCCGYKVGNACNPTPPEGYLPPNYCTASSNFVKFDEINGRQYPSYNLQIVFTNPYIGSYTFSSPDGMEYNGSASGETEKIETIRLNPSSDYNHLWRINGENFSCTATYLPPPTEYGCGNTYATPPLQNGPTCLCESGVSPISSGRVCCGWILNNECIDHQPTDYEVNQAQDDFLFDVKQGISKDALNALNPLVRESSDNEASGELSTPAGIINRALRYLFPIAGLILFVMIVWGGFEMLSTAATKKSVDAGRQRIQAAAIGFILLFISYWIMQIIEAVFSVSIL